MSEGMLKLAACGRALLNHLPGEERYSDKRIYDEFVAEDVETLSAAFAALDPKRDYDLLADYCFSTLREFGGPIGVLAVEEALDLVDHAPRHQSGLTDAVLVGGVVTFFGSVGIAVIVISCRLRSFKTGTTEIEMYEGVPPAAVDLFKLLNGPFKKAEKAIKKADKVVGKLTSFGDASDDDDDDNNDKDKDKEG